MSTGTVKRAGRTTQQQAKAATPNVALKPDEVRELLTVAEAAYLLHVSPRTAWNYVWSDDPDKRLETVWIGGRRFVPRLAVTEYVSALRSMPHRRRRQADLHTDLMAG